MSAENKVDEPAVAHAKVQVEETMKLFGQDANTPAGRMLKVVATCLYAVSTRNDIELSRLRKEVAELRADRVKFCGVYQRALTYTRGDLVTHAGSLWSCVAEQTQATPGTTNGWQLAVKRGDLD